MDDKEQLFKQQLQELHDCYQNELPEKITEISTLWTQLSTNWNKESTLVLIGHLHRIAGSAGSFGFRLLGEYAREAQQDLLVFKEAETAPDSEQLKVVAAAIDKITSHNI